MRHLCREASSPLPSVTLLVSAMVCRSVLHGFNPSPGRFTLLQDAHPVTLRAVVGLQTAMGLCSMFPLCRDGDGSCSAARTTGQPGDSGTHSCCCARGCAHRESWGREKGDVWVMTFVFSSHHYRDGARLSREWLNLPVGSGE